MAWRAGINTIIIISYHNFWLLYTLSGILYIIEFKGAQTAVSKTSKIAKMAKTSKMAKMAKTSKMAKMAKTFKMAKFNFRQSLSFFALFLGFFFKKRKHSLQEFLV